jgi:ABC-type multidrug transport system fused ATPase/permease subunit
MLVDWPAEPKISLENFSLRYREELPLVLKNISLKIEAGERVGIIGRTGAGKSSIIQALFRIAEP